MMVRVDVYYPFFGRGREEKEDRWLGLPDVLLGGERGYVCGFLHVFRQIFADLSRGAGGLSKLFNLKNHLWKV